MNLPCFLANAIRGVNILPQDYRVYELIEILSLLLTGVKVSCPGNPGHGSRFIEGTAAEKLRTVINRFLEFRQQEKNRMDANPELTLGEVTTINLTKIEVKGHYTEISSAK